MNVQAASGSTAREHTYLDPFDTESGCINGQARDLDTRERLQIENAVNSLGLITDQPQSQSQLRTQSPPNQCHILGESQRDIREAIVIEDNIDSLERITDCSQNRPQSQLAPGFKKITLEAELAKKDKQLEAARRELSKIVGEKTKLKQEVGGATHKRRFHDLGAEPNSSIDREPERIKLPKRTVLGIIQNQGGRPTDQPKDGQNTEAEKIKLKRRAQARAHVSRLDQLERENKRLKATVEKRDGQIKELVNADKENRNSRHFGNAESREAGFRPPPGFHWFS